MTTIQDVQATDLFSHLRSYSRELFSLDRRPLIDQTFSFPWDAFSQELKKTFGCDISIAPKEFGWKAKAELFTSVSAPLIPIAIAIPGISGQALLLISKADVEHLMTAVLHVDAATLVSQDPSFFDQFSLFFTAELVACAQGIPSLKELSPRLTTRQETESAGCLCQDIVIQIQGESSLARFIMTPEFLEAWRTFRMGPEIQPTPSSLSGLDITVSVEAGRTFLTSEELSTLHPGDFLLIDHPFFIPGSSKARVFLTHNGHPLFRAKVQEGNVKILEMPLQHEAFLPLGGVAMSTNKDLPQQPRKRMSAEDDPPLTTTTQENSSDPIDPESQNQDPPQENPFEGEESEEQEETSSPMTEEEALAATQMPASLSKEAIKIDQLPLTVVVELTELTMSIEKLTSLQPGNLLDLDIRPENGVMLVVNGKALASGELVLIGDNVGVRIKEIGFGK